MSEKNFWEVIDMSVLITKEKYPSFANPKSDFFYEKQAEIIVNVLSTSTDEDIYDFHNIFWRNYNKLYSTNPYIILYMLEGSLVDDDRFRTFNCWVIIQGKDFFDKVLNEPDELADLIEKDFTYYTEDFFDLADQAFLKKNGVELPDEMLSNNQTPETHQINKPDEKDLPTLFPNLWDKFKSF